MKFLYTVWIDLKLFMASWFLSKHTAEGPTKKDNGKEQGTIEDSFGAYFIDLYHFHFYSHQCPSTLLAFINTVPFLAIERLALTEKLQK